MLEFAPKKNLLSRETVEVDFTQDKKLFVALQKMGVLQFCYKVIIQVCHYLIKCNSKDDVLPAVL